MRKIIVSMNITLNGCFAGPCGELDWHYRYWGDDMARVKAIQLGNADTIILGRVTYQAMARYWPAAALEFDCARQDADFAEMMNRAEKVVFSQTLKNARGWANSRVAGQTLAKEVAALKDQGGKHIMIYGSGKLVAALHQLDLIDEYHLWLHPVVIENGRPLFSGLVKKMRFSNQAQFDSGVVLMSYKAFY